MKHTLITVTYNSAMPLKNHWANIDLPPGVQWVVVDNSSSDDSVKIAKHLGAKVYSLPTNLGFGAANNYGFNRTSSEYVWFVNPDVRVNFADLDLLATIASTHSGLVAPQLHNADGTLQPNGRGLPYLFYKVLNRLAPSSIIDRYHVYADENEVKPCSWLTGAVVGGSRAILEKLGPWDERFFVYYEDSDLGLRASSKGHSSLVVGNCRWLHSWARDTLRFSFKPWKLELASMIKFYVRYPKFLLLPLRKTSN